MGTWEWQNGNQIFRVSLWKEEQDVHKNGNKPSFYKDKIRGHYELIEINGSTETVIYTSQKNIGQSNTPWFPTITVTAYDNNVCGGIVNDNSIEDINYPMGIRGWLKLNIIGVTQMEWKVSLPDGMYGTDQPTTFNIPTDIILTKQ